MYIVFVFSALIFVHLGLFSPAAVLCAHEHGCVTVHMYIAVNIFNNVCMCVRACKIERERYIEILLRPLDCLALQRLALL